MYKNMPFTFSNKNRQRNSHNVSTSVWGHSLIKDNSRAKIQFTIGLRQCCVHYYVNLVNKLQTATFTLNKLIYFVIIP